MEWGEFSSLLAGLNGETPLGNIVRIRRENDNETLKNFSKDELKIRCEWRNKNTSSYQMSEEDYNTAMESIKNMFTNMAKKGR